MITFDLPLLSGTLWPIASWWNSAPCITCGSLAKRDNGNSSFCISATMGSLTLKIQSSAGDYDLGS
jgi:hypothetical protein